jgi:hypothetical protein
MLEQLMKVFFIITLLFMPVMLIYYNGNGYNHLGGLDKMFAPFTLGNIGFASTDCQYHFVSMKEPSRIECHKGTISKAKHWGLMPTGTGFDQDYCGVASYYEKIEHCTN